MSKNGKPASRELKARASSRASTSNRPTPNKPPAHTQPDDREHQLVHPHFLLAGVLGTTALALLSVYAVLCLLFYQGQWQLVLEPTRTIARTPAALGMQFEDVHFDAVETGQPRLTGWWIPGGASATPKDAASVTSSEKNWSQPANTDGILLYFHDGKGNIGDSLNELERLHSLGLSIFAFDYRGFGTSDPQRPNQARMNEDGLAALNYILGTRHIPSAKVVLLGHGLGAAVATHVAAQFAAKSAAISNPAVPKPAESHAQPATGGANSETALCCLILEDLPASQLDKALRDPRAKLLPVRLLFHERFDASPDLTSLPQAKLFLQNSDTQPSAYSGTSDPKWLVYLDSSNADPKKSDARYAEALHSFLDQYLR